MVLLLLSVERSSGLSSCSVSLSDLLLSVSTLWLCIVVYMGVWVRVHANICVSAFRSMCKKVAVTQKSAFGKQSQLITAVTLNVHDSRGVTPHVQNVKELVYGVAGKSNSTFG